MGVETRLLGGRVLIRRRPGALWQFLRGALGVFLFVAAGTAAVYLLPILVDAVSNTVVDVASPTEYLTTGQGVSVDPAVPDVEMPSGGRLTVLLVAPVLLYLGGLAGYAVRWRRTYEVSVAFPDGILGWT